MPCCQRSALRFSVLAGQMNLGQIAFVAIGAYTSALLVTKFHIPFLGGMVAAGLTAGLIGIALGLGYARASGVYWALASMVLVEVVRITILLAKPLTGGALGISGIPPPDLVVVKLQSASSQYWLGLVLLGVSLAVMHVVENSRLGLTWKAIGSRQDLAASVGINVYRYKVLAFAFSGFFAGIAGSYYAHTTSYITSESGFGILESVAILLYVFIGGKDRFIGPIIGAPLLILLSQPFKGARQYEMLFFSMAAMAIILALPRGLVSVSEKFAVFKRRKGNPKKDAALET